MVAADIIRDALQGIPELPVPYPDAWRYMFIALGFLVMGASLAIAVQAGLVSRNDRRNGGRRKVMAWHIRLVAIGTNLIVLLLVAALYLRLGMGDLSPLIYPAMLGEALLAAGLILLLLDLRKRQVARSTVNPNRKEHHR